MKSYPKTDEIRKRIKRSSTGALETVAAKKPKIVEVAASQSAAQHIVVTETAIDITEQYIMERMCPELATDLVIMAMVRPSRRPDILIIYLRFMRWLSF